MLTLCNLEGNGNYNEFKPGLAICDQTFLVTRLCFLEGKGFSFLYDVIYKKYHVTSGDIINDVA